MNELQDFTRLLEQAAQNDAAAVQRLVSEYAEVLHRAARHQLGQVMRRHLDSLNIVQSVYRTLIAGLRKNRFDITSPEKFVALALLIIRRKIARKWRKLRDAPSGLPDDGSRSAWDEIAAPSSTGQAEVDSDEALQRVLNELDPLDSQLVQLRVAGLSTADAARRLGIDSGLLRVRLGRLRNHLRERGLLQEWL